MPEKKYHTEEARRQAARDAGKCCYHKHREKCLKRNKEWRRKNKEKAYSSAVTWRLANPEKFKATNRKYNNKKKLRKYGLTPELFETLWNKQSGKCAVCETELKRGPLTNAIDHDHCTNQIRGILCAPCNLGIGNFKDSITLLEKAKQYLMAVSDEER